MDNNVRIKLENFIRQGVRIELEYICENGHHGVITLTFHKGLTYVGHRELLKLKHDKWKTIWRD